MDNRTKYKINEAAETIAKSLRPDSWQAIVAVRGGKYPYTFEEKVKMARSFLEKGRDEKLLNL